MHVLLIKEINPDLCKNKMEEKIYLSSPHMGGKEQEYVNQAFDTNWIAPLGPHVSGFENELEHYLGEHSHVAALSSGTAAIHLALILLGVKAGDEVICQESNLRGRVQLFRYLLTVKKIPGIFVLYS